MKRIFLLALTGLLFSCNSDDVIKLNSDNYILSFEYKQDSVFHEIQMVDNLIQAVLPNEVDLTGLEFKLEISKGATISPDPRSITSFTQPIDFTVTAENGEEREYHVDISKELNDKNLLLNFGLTKGSYFKEFQVMNDSIQGLVAKDIELNELELNVSISENATIEPDPATITSISGPFIFTITAENGSQREYHIDISRELSGENSLLSFGVIKGSYFEEFQVVNDSVHGVVPTEIELNELVLDVSISENATIEPDPATITSISGPFIFTITAENGSQKEYHIDISRELSGENSLLSFGVIKGSYFEEFQIVNDSIQGIAPAGIKLVDIELNVSISENATIAPDPATITSISGPFIFTITAENGSQREYTVAIREMSDENSLTRFNVITDLFSSEAQIDQVNNIITTRRMPEFIDLTNLEVEINYSDLATISPLPTEVTDYSSPVSFTVTSESGIERVYQVVVEIMNTDYFDSCETSDANQWFGGDNRTNAPDINPYDRNVATGQSFVMANDLVPSVFSVHFTGPFRYDESATLYEKDLEVKLNVREENGNIISYTTTTIPGSFNGGWVDFDLSGLNLFLKENNSYVFTWYLVNGAELGVSNGAFASQNGCSGNSSYTGESFLSKGTDLEAWNTWWQSGSGWGFNYRLQGKE